MRYILVPLACLWGLSVVLGSAALWTDRVHEFAMAYPVTLIGVMVGVSAALAAWLSGLE